jgi:hypothetical protein
MATFTGQKAKMLAGELYMASDPELSFDHLRAQAIHAKFNATCSGCRRRTAHFAEPIVRKYP